MSICNAALLFGERHNITIYLSGQSYLLGPVLWSKELHLVTVAQLPEHNSGCSIHRDCGLFQLGR